MAVRKPKPLTAADLPEFVRAPFLTTLASWQAGGVRTCQHSPTPTNGRGAFSAVWNQGLVVCSECTILLSPPRSSAENSRCDRCGEQVVLRATETTMRVGLACIDGLTYLFGICTDCRAAMG